MKSDRHVASLPAVTGCPEAAVPPGSGETSALFRIHLRLDRGDVRVAETEMMRHLVHQNAAHQAK